MSPGRQETRRALTLDASGASGLKRAAIPSLALQLGQRITASSASEPVRTTRAPQGLHFQCGPAGKGGAAAFARDVPAGVVEGGVAGAAGGNLSFRIGRLAATGSAPSTTGALAGNVEGADLAAGFAEIRDRRTIFGSRAMFRSGARKGPSRSIVRPLDYTRSGPAKTASLGECAGLPLGEGITVRETGEAVATAALRN